MAQTSLETTTGGVLAGFGVPIGAATISILGYRIVSFWLPVVCGIPFGLACFAARTAAQDDLAGVVVHFERHGAGGTDEPGAR